MTGPSLSKAVNSRPGWYRGGFHVHKSTSNVVEMARAEGLDFIAITDHNTIEALSELGESPDFLVVPGIEITVDDGELNVFGMEGGGKWMEDICVGRIQVSLTGRCWRSPTRSSFVPRVSTLFTGTVIS